MERKLRQSVFRVLTDLVKSDDLITAAELDGIDKYARHFGLSSADRASSYNITLSEAFQCIAIQDNKTKNEIRDAMSDIAIRDNECCRSEAILLTLMDYICDGAELQVISAPARNRSLLNRQLVYLENKETLRGCDELDNDFDELSNLARIAGLELIYIPHIAKHFKNHSNQEDLRRLMCLISPQSDPKGIDNTLDAIKGMSSKFFYDNVIRGKLELNFSISSPSWLFRIPDSNIAGIPYINLFCLSVGKNIKAQLMQLINRLNSRQGSYSVKVNDGWGRESSFMYSGFYKALFDLMSVRKIDKWDILIRLYGDGTEPFRYVDENGRIKKCVMTIKRGIEEYPLPLTARDAAFYLLLCCASAASEDSGIDFYDDSLKEITQRRYAQLFRALSRRSEEPLVWDPVFRVPMRSRIRSAINASPIANQSSLQAIYEPEEIRRGVLRVGVEPERILIDGLNGPIPLKESSLYRMYLKPLM